jgi:YHS domain-containing protein
MSPIKRGTLILSLVTITFGLGQAKPFPADGTGESRDNASVSAWLEKGMHKLNVDKNGVILRGYDPVAYFTRKKAIKGTAKYQTTYQGATFHFSSAADLALFNQNPAKYIPQYGGFCANVMKNRRADGIDPTVFFIINGKLYLCTSPAAEKEFRSNEKQNIKKADQNWDEEYRWWY